MIDFNNLTEKEVRALVERYPFLLPRNVFTGEVCDDYDYTYITGLEIPSGWNQVFLQMCEDIRQPLIDADYLNEFRFCQVKEKYNTLRCYHFGAPDVVCDIINKYEMMAYYICTKCGKPATYETQGYYESFCTDCWKDYARHRRVEPIHFKDYFEITTYSDGKLTDSEISFKDEWERYLKGLDK